MTILQRHSYCQCQSCNTFKPPVSCMLIGGLTVSLICRFFWRITGALCLSVSPYFHICTHRPMTFISSAFEHGMETVWNCNDNPMAKANIFKCQNIAVPCYWHSIFSSQTFSATAVGSITCKFQSSLVCDSHDSVSANGNEGKGLQY